MLSLNGYHVVQTFFMISGLLMGLAFKDMYDKTSFKWSYFGLATFYRYVRYDDDDNDDEGDESLDDHLTFSLF